MDRLPEPIPINALFSADDEGPNPELESEIRSWLDDADLIFGTDVMSGQAFIVFGRDIVERIAGGEPPGEEVRILNIALDHDTDDLQRLLSLVARVKGGHDYVAFGSGDTP